MSEPVRIELCQLPHGADLPLPHYQTDGAAGMDLYAALAGPVLLTPMQRQLIPTGLQIALPPGYEAQIRPRSGLALKQGLTLLNSPGTIDSDYRGEIGVILINLFLYSKIAFLNFYYLPIMLAGYYLGRRTAVLGARSRYGIGVDVMPWPFLDVIGMVNFHRFDEGPAVSGEDYAQAELVLHLFY